MSIIQTDWIWQVDGRARQKQPDWCEYEKIKKLYYK